jgi:hypothetical protein
VGKVWIDARATLAVLIYFRALDDLPGDLDDIVKVLHAHTGAEIWAISAWRTLTGELYYTEYVPRLLV